MLKQELAQALKLVAPALHSRDFIPVLTHVCFSGDSLFAFDDKTAVVVFMETGIEAAVRGRVLIEMVDNAEDELELELDENHIVLSDGSSTLKLPALSPETFLFEMPDTEACSVSISGDLDGMREFMECLELAASNSNEESLRQELVGVTLKADDDLLLYSTDNISCTKVSVESVTVAGEGVAIIPKSSCGLLAKTFRDLSEGLSEFSIFLLENTVLGVYTMEDQPDVWVVCKTIPAAPADYEKILDQHLDEGEYGDVPEGLEKALSRASAMFKDDYSRAVMVEPADEGFQLYCKGEYGELVTTIESEVWPEDPVNLNPDLVKRMIGSCQGLMFCKNALSMVYDGDQHQVTYLVAYKRS